MKIYQTIFGNDHFFNTVIIQGQSQKLFTWVSTNACFKDVSEHLITVHNNNFEWKMAEDEKNKWVTDKLFDNSFFDFNSLVFPPEKITNTKGDSFYGVGRLTDNAFYFVIYLFGSPEEARQFSCTISASNKVQ